MYSINLTRSHIFLVFCEQTLKMDANDASGQGLQSARKNRHQHKFSRKLWVKNPFSDLLFTCYSPFPTYDPHTILKKCTTEMNYNYFYFWWFQRSNFHNFFPTANKAGRFKKHQHPPFFSKMRTFFKNRPRWSHFYSRFLSCIFKKMFFPRRDSQSDR